MHGLKHPPFRLMNAPRLALLFLLGFLSAASAQRNYGNEEYVILSGGPALRAWEEYRAPGDQHDKFWGNFIRSARIRMDQLRRIHGDALRLTWLVYRPGYVTRSREDQVKRPEYICDTSEIIRIASERKVNLVWVDSKNSLISYLNNRGGRKMSGFDYFGHSNKYCFLLDYSNDILGVSSSYLHCTDLNRLHRGIFTRDAQVQSWGCNTGDYMSRVWKRSTGHPMLGASSGGIPGCNGKTDYSAIADGKSLPRVSGRWVD